MKIRVILTSVGGLVAPNMIKSLKEDTSDEFYIVGVDVNEEAVGFHFADKSYTVPQGNSNEYSEHLLNIAKKEKVDVILPLSDEELLSLSKNKEKFKKEGILIPCSDYEIVNIASNKATMLQFLEKSGIPVPEYRIPHNINELQTAAEALGYPKEPVVFKPCRARGARGFWVLRGDIDKRHTILYSRDRQEISFEWLLESLADNKQFPDVLVMEYLPGEDFNVDVLAWHGDSLYIIPNQRIVPKAGPVQVGRIKEDREVQNMVRRVVKEFGFDYWVNVEAAYSKEPDSSPLVYEINPRISAPIVATKAAGVDLLRLGIKLALGEKVGSNLSFRETKMIRYWNELFIYGKNRFDSKSFGNPPYNKNYDRKKEPKIYLNGGLL